MEKNGAFSNDRNIIHKIIESYKNHPSMLKFGSDLNSFCFQQIPVSILE